jgi:mannosyl-oligosaccharide alpha-1,2-mannosidase
MSTYQRYVKFLEVLDTADIYKQYLLLAGREEKYRKMYLKAVAAVRKWMLFRPMVPGEEDILVSGIVSTRGYPEKDLKLIANADHLTCFVGGMIGMGAKIFNIEGDLEIAKKLTDGCVWAYSSTPSGIMPETGTLLACESPESCAWNETLYRLAIDPLGEKRDAQLNDYLALEAKKLELLESEADVKLAMQLEIGVEDGFEGSPEANSGLEENLNKFEDTMSDHGEASVKSQTGSRFRPQQEAAKTDDGLAYVEDATTTEEFFARNSESDEAEGEDYFNSNLAISSYTDSSKTGSEKYANTNNAKRDVTDDKTLAAAITPRTGQQSSTSDMAATYQLDRNKVQKTKAKVQNIPAGRQAEVPLKETNPLAEPTRPFSQEDYVNWKIEHDRLPPGYVSVTSRSYILR